MSVCVSVCARAFIIPNGRDANDRTSKFLNDGKTLIIITVRLIDWLVGLFFFNAHNMHRKCNFGQIRIQCKEEERKKSASRLKVKSIKQQSSQVKIHSAVFCLLVFSPYHSRASCPPSSAHPPGRDVPGALSPLSPLLHACKAQRHSESASQ